jgi:hypothetical protein
MVAGDDGMDLPSSRGKESVERPQRVVAAASFPAHPVVHAMTAICGFTKIHAGQHVLNAEDPLPPDRCDVLALIR